MIPICLVWLFIDLLTWLELVNVELVLRLEVPPNPTPFVSEFDFDSWKVEFKDGTLKDNTFGSVPAPEIAWFEFCFESLIEFVVQDELLTVDWTFEECSSNPAPRFCLFSVLRDDNSFDLQLILKLKLFVACKVFEILLLIEDVEFWIFWLSIFVESLLFKFTNPEPELLKVLFESRDSGTVPEDLDVAKEDKEGVIEDDGAVLTFGLFEPIVVSDELENKDCPLFVNGFDSTADEFVLDESFWSLEKLSPFKQPPLTVEAELEPIALFWTEPKDNEEFAFDLTLPNKLVAGVELKDPDEPKLNGVLVAAAVFNLDILFGVELSEKLNPDIFYFKILWKNKLTT